MTASTKMHVRHDRIVVAIPCFNEARWIEETLKSLTAQTMRDFAVLISDNASTDGTADIAERYIFNDTRFQIFRHEKNNGAALNFNFVRDNTSSPLFVWLGAHDLLHAEFLAHHLSEMDSNENLSVSQSAHEWIDEQGLPVERVEDFPLDEGRTNSIGRYLASIRANRHNIGINSVIRRSMLEGTVFSPVIGTDRIILSRLAYRGPFATSPKVLYYRRTFSSERDGWSGYMERLTGVFGYDASDGWSLMAAAYDDDLKSLIGDGARQRGLRTFLQLILRYYLPINRGSVTTTILWGVRRVIKRLKRLK